MSRHVPDFVDPIRAAEGGYVVAGRLAYARMKRLLELVENTGGAAEIALEFAVDGQGIAAVRGQIKAELELVCQRCLEAMTVPVSAQINLGIVASEEEAKRLPGQYDPVMVHGEQLPIADLVEDELLLALPAIPRHDSTQCAAVGTTGQDDAEGLPAGPFAILARLKAGR